ncbi:MAG: zinc-dependent alcohol dehydrogenase family protein [Deinococcus sp.]|nr:zinc-dependent alcohol dehydrogenase family protein [Deinococcus sp.]
MRALVLITPQPVAQAPLKLADMPVPAPGLGEVLVQVRTCGVCHTDLHLVEGELPRAKRPVVPGHQVVGVVAQVGPGVSQFTPGQRVGVAWLHRACGACDFCRRGEENLCPGARFTGCDVDGGYAEYLLAQVDFTYALPGGFSDAQAAPLLCAGIIGYRSLRLSEVRPGERLGLFGFGASAHLASQVARHWGCQVLVFTRSTAHRELARQLGAVWAGAADDKPPEPLDRAIVFAPVGWVVVAALRQLRPGGTLAINAVHLDRIPEFDYQLLYGERTMRSVANSTRRDAVEFLKLAETVPIRTRVESYPLEEANRALLRLKAGEVQGAAVLAVV